MITVESAYQTRARSPKGAKGLMQLMPDTARQYGVRNAYNAAANLEAGIKHLKSLLNRFELSLALAAYNAGEATVRASTASRRIARRATTSPGDAARRPRSPSPRSTAAHHLPPPGPRNMTAPSDS